MSKRKRAVRKENNTIEFNEYVQRKQTVQLIPKSLNQEEYIDKLLSKDKLIVFAVGPAGTGKTMLAVLAAIKAYKENKVEKIIITRPTVSADEELGFLPGKLEEKMAPWTRPVFDVLYEYYSPKQVLKMIEEGIIEISPLAYMRGRTFKNSYIIADETQNATPNQMKMLLTRLGEGSKMVVTGDIQQTDRKSHDNGLLDFKTLLEKFTESNYVSMCEFKNKDIMRHPAVKEILTIYGEIS